MIDMSSTHPLVVYLKNNMTCKHVTNTPPCYIFKEKHDMQTCHHHQALCRKKLRVTRQSHYHQQQGGLECYCHSHHSTDMI